MRMSTRFDCPFFVKILRKFITWTIIIIIILIFLFVSSIGGSVILIAGN